MTVDAPRGGVLVYRLSGQLVDTGREMQLVASSQGGGGAAAPAKGAANGVGGHGEAPGGGAAAANGGDAGAPPQVPPAVAAAIAEGLASAAAAGVAKKGSKYGAKAAALELDALSLLRRAATALPGGGRIAPAPAPPPAAAAAPAPAAPAPAAPAPPQAAAAAGAGAKGGGGGEGAGGLLHFESKPAKWIYVLDTAGRLYLHPKQRGTFHHSSFTRGGAVLSAGGMVVSQGRITKLTADSGAPWGEGLRAKLQMASPAWA